MNRIVMRSKVGSDGILKVSLSSRILRGVINEPGNVIPSRATSRETN